ncbi:MAG: reverse transcriptase family protein [Kofleriaceae bacterium]
MGFWDKVKKVFGGGGATPPVDPPTESAPPGPAASSRRGRRPSNRTWRLNKRGDTLLLIAPHGTFRVRGLTDQAKQKLAQAAEGAELVCQGDLEGGGTIEHLIVTEIDLNTVPVAEARAAAAARPVMFTGDDDDDDDDDAPPRTATPTNARDRYRNDEVLGLSGAELRKRMLRVSPWRTAWIGRVDVIPPQSDERTALIDRGLILRGLLTEAQIDEIHRIGDEWLKHVDAVRFAEVAAHKNAAAAVQAERERRQQAKIEKQREAAEKRAAHQKAVAERRANDIIFAGRGVSARLGDRRAQVEQLAKLGLPVLATPGDVAKALDLTIPQLRWLCFHAEAASKTHYVYFEVPKRSGGTRLLAAPHARLGKAQRWILDNILAKLEVTQHAHGFVADRSTVTNARLHLQKNIVVNLDLESFFPTITYPRVRGLFESLGYSPAAATLLALLVTEAPRMKVLHDGTPYWVAAGDRALPQGACTSPVISNLVARKLDRRLAGAATKLGWTYSRYADDLTFSASGEPKAKMSLMMSRVRAIVRDEGFAINEAKGRVQRHARRQQVTGIVVNDKLGAPREEIRRLRAILHRAKQTGLAAQNRDKRPDFEAYLRGKIAYITMIDPAKGAALRAQLEAGVRLK